LPRKGYRGQCHRGALALLTRNSKQFSVKMTSLSGTVNKITGDNCKCMDQRRGGQGHGSGSLPILHQAVTWSLTSPLYNDTIHLTGVYIFPDENQLQEFFDTLIAHSNHSPHEPHIYAGEIMPTLPKNWKPTSHLRNYEPSSAAQEILTQPIPLPPPSHLLRYQPPTTEDVYS